MAYVKPWWEVLHPDTSKIQNIAIHIPNFATPQAKPKGDTSTKIIDRKTIQDIGRKFPSILIQFIDPHLNQYKTFIPDIPGSLLDFDPELAIDSKDNCPFQDGISETYQRPDKSYFQEPQELEILINTGRLVQKFLPKQADSDKILKIIERKVLKGMHLTSDFKRNTSRFCVDFSFCCIIKQLVDSLEQNIDCWRQTFIQPTAGLHQVWGRTEMLHFL